MPSPKNTAEKKPWLVTLHRHWVLAVLLLLVLASFVSGQVALLVAFVFTFLVPGLIFFRFFNLKSYEFLAFVPIFSVLLSTQLVYYASLLFGYSSLTIIGTFLLLTAIYGVVDWGKPAAFPIKNLLEACKRNKMILVVFLLIFVVSFAVLYRTVWFETGSGIVLTGSNWQDTPLHYEIIESLNNGNFPPQMPYYAGEKMSYHYFVDFHTAILEKVYGFLPQLLPFLNTVFIVIFALAIYALARDYGKRGATLATVVATFGWGLSYILLFSAFADGSFNPTQNYAYQYAGLFGLPPIFDNLLQQRPLLIGLPVFALVLALLRNMDDKNRVFLAGVVTGLVFPFHAVAFICCYIAFFVSILLNAATVKKHYLYFLVSTGLALPFIISGNPAIPFFIAPLWALNFLKDNPILFYLLNLGVPLVLSLVFVKKVGGTLLKVVLLILFLIPNLVSITPNPWDMYKFFIFAWIPIAVLSGAALSKVKKPFAVALLLLSILASANVVIYNIGTNYTAATWDEYNLGMWVRENTPQQSVFLTYYSIHSSPIMIGGRLAVASYVNWAYGHGVPLDQVNDRLSDIDRAYTGTEVDLRQVIITYNVSYVYVGLDELRYYRGCLAKFDSVSWLQPVYNGTLHLYKVNL